MRVVINLKFDGWIDGRVAPFIQSIGSSNIYIYKGMFE